MVLLMLPCCILELKLLPLLPLFAVAAVATGSDVVDIAIELEGDDCEVVVDDDRRVGAPITPPLIQIDRFVVEVFSVISTRFVGWVWFGWEVV